MKATAMMYVFVWSLTALAGEAPTTDEIVASMMDHDEVRQSSLGNYVWTSNYVLDNKDRHAEMLVQWSRQLDGTKCYKVVYERGDGGVRDHVFRKLLESEVEASRAAVQDRNRLNTKNYVFLLTGREDINGRLAYVLEIEPKTDSKYLTKGRIWVDATDYAVIRIEGSPSKKPSFWTNSVSFVQSFERSGGYWMAASNRSLTDAKLFGKAELVITFSDYKFTPTVIGAR